MNTALYTEISEYILNVVIPVTRIHPSLYSCKPRFWPWYLFLPRNRKKEDWDGVYGFSHSPVGFHTHSPTHVCSLPLTSARNRVNMSTLQQVLRAHISMGEWQIPSLFCFLLTFSMAIIKLSIFITQCQQRVVQILSNFIPVCICTSNR